MIQRTENYEGYGLALMSKIGELYFNLEEINEVPLILFTLIEFDSLMNIDMMAGEGRFMSSLAKRLA